MGFQELQRRRGAHLTRNDTCQIPFYREHIDCPDFISVNDKLKAAGKSLLFFSLPMEGCSDRHILQGERRIIVCRRKTKLLIATESPKHLSFHELHSLFAAYRPVTENISPIQAEAYLLTAQYAY